MGAPELTIFTPTYNRAYKIEDLYQSLLDQTNKDFIWLVVDDGSTDETEDLMKGMISENKLHIKYVKQKNGGKARAHNRGVSECDTELFFCVDSDDVVPPRAVEQVLQTWASCRMNKGVAGIIAMRGKDENTPIAKRFPDGLEYTTMWDLYYKLHHKGDTALIYRTDILRQYPFVVEPGEKFIAETYVYHQIDQKYRLRVLNQIVWITEYLPDGYTQNVRKVTRENPLGYMRLKRMYIDYSDTLPLKVENTALYLVGAYFAGRLKESFAELPNKPVAFVSLPIAWLLWNTAFKA